MRTSCVANILISGVLCFLPGTMASAHPGSGIVVDKQGNVYFTDTGRGVWKIDTQGILTYVPAPLWHWMAIDEAGTFAQSQKTFGETFERVTPQGSKPVLMLCSDFPITVSKDKNIYVAYTRPSSPGIARRLPDGSESVIARGKMFQDISGITAGPDGTLYVTDASRPDSNAIRTITMDGTVSLFAEAFAGNVGANDLPPETPAGYCRGLAVDSQGVVYVAATGSRKVLRITPQGSVSTILQTSKPWSPTGVTFFRGEVYVLEWSEPAAERAEIRKAWTPRVRKVGRNGEITTLAVVPR